MTYNNEIREGVTLRLMNENYKYKVVEDDGTDMVTVATFNNVIDALTYYEEYFKTECDCTEV